MTEEHYQKHKFHTVTIGHDGVNKCECGDTWPNMVGRTPLDLLLAGE